MYKNYCNASFNAEEMHYIPPKLNQLYSNICGMRITYIHGLVFPPANLEASLPLLLECHRLQSRVLHKHNMQLARTSDAIAHTYALQGI